MCVRVRGMRVCVCVHVCAARVHEAGEEEASVKTSGRREAAVGFDSEGSVWRSGRRGAKTQTGAGNGAPGRVAGGGEAPREGQLLARPSARSLFPSGFSMTPGSNPFHVAFRGAEMAVLVRFFSYFFLNRTDYRGGDVIKQPIWKIRYSWFSKPCHWIIKVI